MAINLAYLPKILYNPKLAFSEMREHTGFLDGLGVYAILFVLSITVFYVMHYMGTFTQVVTPLGASYSASYIPKLSLQLFFILMAIGAFLLLLTSFVATHLARFLFRTDTSFDKTVGFLGYTYLIDVIVGIAISVVTAVGLSTALSTTYSNNILSISGINQTMGFATLGLIVFAIIWKLYVGGYAISIANNLSANSGVLIYLLSAVIITTIIFLIGLLFSSIPTLNIFAGTRAY